MSTTRDYRPKYSVRSNYDRLSRWYDLLTFNSEERLAKQAIRQLDLKPGESVLEIGCGTGANLHRISQNISSTGLMIGLDLSSGMLSHARGKISAKSTGNIIHLIQGDGENLPIASGEIDAILLSFTLELFDPPGIAAVLAECRRVLSPSGRVGVVGLSRKPGNTLPVRVYDWFHARFPAKIDCRPILIEETLSAGGYNILHSSSLNLFGLPVEVVIAKGCSNPIISMEN
jgi:ubiquinone/menaquinone biosynthesis C-methylase UbiE